AVYVAARGIHAPTCEGRDRRRRRRRAVRRLRSLLRQRLCRAVRQSARVGAPRAAAGVLVDSRRRLVQERRTQTTLATPPLLPFGQRALRREPHVLLFRSRTPR